MRVLGIDPGYERLGVAILEKNKNKEILLFSDCFQTDKSEALSERIFSLGQRVDELIKKWLPDALAIEKLFFTTNQKTAMGVAETKGVLTYVAKSAGLTIHEYTPLQIKIAITGYGKATKEQMLYMLDKLLLIERKDKIKHDDEFDAIAVALTCLVSTK
ncbi:MAG: crossover junction endodeoxyribonuclease RuvC [bacterium]|nr:crossover junction endodeoxyribonuclease RuvC [bacterium]